MIYLVSSNRSLFKSDKYQEISPKEAIEMLSKELILGADTETEGLDPYTDRLLTIQLGNETFQIVWDCQSYKVEMLKPILENPNIKTIWWNAKFDLKFLYHKRIVPTNVYDGMIAEELMYLGFPSGMHSMSLKSAGENYCNIELDKTVRGKIVKVGLTPEVIEYAAKDVEYLIPIYKAQQDLLKEKKLLKAAQFENEFVKCLAYIEYCGVRIDVSRWKKKMENDQHNVEIFTKALDNWIIASQKGETSCICYIDTYNRSEKDIYKDKSNPFYKERVPEKDISFDSGASFEAYKVEVVPLEYHKKLWHLNIQASLFEEFDDTGPKCDVNWSSSQQVIPILETMGFDVKEFDKKEKKYKKSASGKVIAKQINHNSFALMYCKYKEWKKKTESFGQNYLDAINPVSGRLHTNFFQFGTDTAENLTHIFISLFCISVLIIYICTKIIKTININNYVGINDSRWYNIIVGQGKDIFKIYKNMYKDSSCYLTRKHDKFGPLVEKFTSLDSVNSVNGRENQKTEPILFKEGAETRNGEPKSDISDMVNV